MQRTGKTIDEVVDKAIAEKKERAAKRKSLSTSKEQEPDQVKQDIKFDEGLKGQLDQIMTPFLHSEDIGEKKLMEIPVEEKPTGLSQWKKLGGGPFIMRDWKGKKRIIKKGQVFEARADDIPLAFRDTIVPLQNVVNHPSFDGGKGVTKSNYDVRPSPEKEGFFDIVNNKGKIISEQPMERKDALEIVKQLLK